MVYSLSPERALWGSGEGHCGVRGQQPAERGVIMSLKNPATPPPPCEEKPASMQPTHKRHLHRIQGHQLIDPLSLVPRLHPDPVGATNCTAGGAGELGERTRWANSRSRDLLTTEQGKGTLSG